MNSSNTIKMPIVDDGRICVPAVMSATENFSIRGNKEKDQGEELLQVDETRMGKMYITNQVKQMTDLKVIPRKQLEPKTFS